MRPRTQLNSVLPRLMIDDNGREYIFYPGHWELILPEETLEISDNQAMTVKNAVKSDTRYVDFGEHLIPMFNVRLKRINESRKIYDKAEVEAMKKYAFAEQLPSLIKNVQPKQLD